MYKCNKKFLSLFLVLLLFSAFNIMPVSAATNLNNSKTKYIKNEYLELKKLKQTPKEELLKMGYSETAYEALQNLDVNYAKHIKDLQKKSDKDLKSLRYNDEQINAIRNFDGSTEMMAASSAVCTAWLWYSAYTYNGTYTYATLNYSYDWSGTPLYLLTDSFAVGWNEGFYIQSQVLTVKYIYGTSSSSQQASYTVQGVGNCGVNFKFPLYKTISGHPYIGYTGSGKLTLRKQAKVIEFGAKAVYGHSYISLGSPSITISVSGSGPDASINFTLSICMDEEDEYYINPQL